MTGQEIHKDVRLVRKYCNCGYQAQAYIGLSPDAWSAGFNRTVKITCPMCHKEIAL